MKVLAAVTRACGVSIAHDKLTEAKNIFALLSSRVM